MAITAKGPPYMTEDEALYYKGFGVYNPPMPEVEKRHNEALAKLLKQEAPWEKKHQVGGTHYSDMAVQPWDAMRAWMSPEEYIGYHVGTIIGYLSRHKAKGSEQDLHKAGHHMDELRRYLKEDEEYPW
jgi:hypothetical protein